MNTPTLPFDVCENRHGGSDTSVAANKAAQPSKESQRERVWRVISDAGYFGCTLDEVAVAMGVEVNRISGRLTELILLGRIFKTERKRKTRTGSEARVYVSLRFGKEVSIEKRW